MEERREHLTESLAHVWRQGSMWGEPWREDDGTVRVEDFGGVVWIGLAVLPEDLRDEGFPERMRDLAGQHMPDGRWRCPLSIWPDPSCVDDLERLLREHRLEDTIDVFQTQLAA